FRRADRPDQVYADALPVLHLGKEVGLVATVVARPTREEAREAAADLAGRRDVLAGSFEEVAESILAFQRKGILQFLIRGLPERDFVTSFGAGVLPIVRQQERGRPAVA